MFLGAPKPIIEQQAATFLVNTESILLEWGSIHGCNRTIGYLGVVFRVNLGIELVRVRVNKTAE
jgi:hypothetical protein